MNRVFHGTSVAVLTYIGFDGISTLSEEVDNPKRNIFLATVLVCLITGVLAAAEVYGAQLLSYHHFGKDFGLFSQFGDENVFSHVAGIAGGVLMTKLISVTLLIATIGSGMGSQLGAARLLYGMGRSDAIPKKFFGAIHPKTRVPANNVMFVGVIALIGAFLISYDNGARVAQFRRADRIHGRESGVAHPLLHSGQRPHIGATDPAGSGLYHLPVHLDSPVQSGADRRVDLDGRGHCLWRLEDSWFPRRSGEL